jgi:monoamine oxidase
MRGGRWRGLFYFHQSRRAWPLFGGRFYFAGDRVTWRTGWQEGAVIAAWGAVQSINQQTLHG